MDPPAPLPARLPIVRDGPASGDKGAPNRPVLGAFYMAMAAMLFACLNVLVKQAFQMGMDPLQIAFLRSIFAAAAMMPFMIGPIRQQGWGYLKPNRPGLMFIRGATSSIGVILWMTAVTMLPLTEVTSISFTAPLLATLGSALLLGEVVRLRRWSAIIVGFIGVMIILRPGMIPIEEGMFWAMSAAVFMAMAVLIIKLLTRTDTPDRIVFWTNIWLTLGTLVPAVWVWGPMTWQMWGVAILMGVLGAISHIFLTRSFAIADASVVLPFDYARLPFVAVLGYFMFGETSDIFTWAGAGLIIASAIYLARREQQLAKA